MSRICYGSSIALIIHSLDPSLSAQLIDRDPPAPPTLREYRTSYSTLHKFLYLIHVINALAF